MQPALTATLQAAISWRDVQCPVAFAFCYKLLGIIYHVFVDLARAQHIVGDKNSSKVHKLKSFYTFF